MPFVSLSAGQDGHFAALALRETAEKVLAQQDGQISLSKRDSERFIELLDNPPAHNAALKNALERHRQCMG